MTELQDPIVERQRARLDRRFLIVLALAALLRCQCTPAEHRPRFVVIAVVLIAFALLWPSVQSWRAAREDQQ